MGSDGGLPGSWAAAAGGWAVRAEPRARMRAVPAGSVDAATEVAPRTFGSGEALGGMGTVNWSGIERRRVVGSRPVPLE